MRNILWLCKGLFTLATIAAIFSLPTRDRVDGLADHLYQAMWYNFLASCLLNRMVQDEKSRKKNRPCKQLFS